MAACQAKVRRDVQARVDDLFSAATHHSASSCAGRHIRRATVC